MCPEVTADEFRQFVRYQSLGTLEEVEKRVNKTLPALESDNKTQRDEIRDLKTKVVPEGGKVLTAEETTELEAYRALGKPEAVKAVVEKVPTLEADIARRGREDAFRAAAKAIKWSEDTVATLLDMRSLDGAVVETKREKNDKGEEIEVPYVTLAGEGNKPQKLADFAASAPQLRGLKTEQQAPAPGGKPYTPTTGGQGTPGSAYDPVAAGTKMAEQTLANKTDKSLAFR